MNFISSISRLTSLILVAAAASSLPACGGPELDAQETGQEALIGGARARTGMWDSALRIGTVSVSRDGSLFNARPGCTAVRVGPRHVLTAAHCVQVQSATARRGYGTVRTGYRPGRLLIFTNAKDGNSGPYAFEAIEKTEMHPSWVAACTPSCRWDVPTSVPFPPDVALITLAADLPDSIPTAVVDAIPLLMGERVTIVGYGCEVGVTAGGLGGRLKYDLAQTQLPENTLMINQYVTTPGRAQGWADAGLCPGDSGGPLYRGHSAGSLRVVGINAYYTFRGPAEVPWQNLHTRLARNNPHAVAQWLDARLPAGQVLGLR